MADYSDTEADAIAEPAKIEAVRAAVGERDVRNEWFYAYSTIRRWTEHNIIKTFGTLGGHHALTNVHFLPPDLSTRERPDMRFPEIDPGEYAETASLRGVRVANVFNKHWWLVETVAAGDHVLEPAERLPDPEILVFKTLIVNRGRTIIEIVRDSALAHVTGKVIEARAPPDADGSRMELTAAEDPKISCQNPLDLIRMVLSLPLGTHVSLAKSSPEGDGLPENFLRDLQRVLLGVSDSWIWAHRTLRIVLHVRDYRRIDFLEAVPAAVDDIAPMPDLMTTLDVSYVLPSVDQGELAERPLVVLQNEANVGIVVVRRNVLVSLVPQATRCEIVPQEPIAIVRTRAIDRTTTTVKSALGTLTVLDNYFESDAAGAVFPRGYHAVSSSTRHQWPAACVSFMDYNRTTCALATLANCVALLSHLVYMEARRFVVTVENFRSVELLLDAFVRCWVRGPDHRPLDVVVVPPATGGRWRIPARVAAGRYDLTPSEATPLAVVAAAPDLIAAPQNSPSRTAVVGTKLVLKTVGTAPGVRLHDDLCVIEPWGAIQHVLLQREGVRLLDGRRLIIGVPELNHAPVLTQEDLVGPAGGAVLANPGFTMQTAAEAFLPFARAHKNELRGVRSMTLGSRKVQITDNHILTMIAKVFFPDETLPKDVLDAELTDVLPETVLRWSLSRIPAADAEPILRKIGRWWAAPSGVYTAHYDDTFLLGWLLECLKDGRRELPDYTDHEKFFVNSYNAIHPKFSQKIAPGAVFLAYEFGRLPAFVGRRGLVRYLALTTVVQLCSNSTILLARNLSSGRFTRDLAPEPLVGDLLDNLFLEDGDPWARYAELFGQAVVCEALPHSVQFNDDPPRPLVRVKSVETAPALAQLQGIRLRGSLFNVVCLGFSPMVVVDDAVCFWDFGAPTVVCNTTEVRRKFTARLLGGAVRAFDLEERYDMAPRGGRRPDPMPRSLPVFTPEPGVEMYGRMDPLAENKLSHFIKFGPDNVTAPGARPTMGSVLFEPLRNDSKWAASPGKEPTMEWDQQLNITRVAAPSVDQHETIALEPGHDVALERLLPTAALVLSGGSRDPAARKPYFDTVYVLENTFVRGTTVVRSMIYTKTTDVIPAGAGSAALIILNPAFKRNALDAPVGNTERLFVRRAEALRGSAWTVVVTVRFQTDLPRVTLWAMLKHRETAVLLEPEVGPEATLRTALLGAAHLRTLTRVAVWSTGGLSRSRDAVSPVPLVPLGASDDQETLIVKTAFDPLPGTKAANPLVVWVPRDSQTKADVEIDNAWMAVMTASGTRVSLAAEHSQLNIVEYLKQFTTEQDFVRFRDPSVTLPVVGTPLMWLEKLELAHEPETVILKAPALVYNMSRVAYDNVINALFFPAVGAALNMLGPQARYVFPATIPGGAAAWSRAALAPAAARTEAALGALVGLTLSELRSIYLPRVQTGASNPGPLIGGPVSVIDGRSDEKRCWQLADGFGATLSFGGGSNRRRGVEIGGGVPGPGSRNVTPQAPDAQGFFNALWAFQGLGGEEPVITVTAANLEAVCGALRLFFLTGAYLLSGTPRARTTFFTVNLEGILLVDSLAMRKFTKLFLAPFFLDGSLKTLELKRGLIQKRALTAPHQTSLQQTGANAQFVFLLKQDLLAGPDKSYWRDRFGAQTPRDGNRWVGAVILDGRAQTNDMDSFLAHENFIHG